MADKITIIETETVNSVDINYNGNINYKKTSQLFNSGEVFNIKDISENPISYSISRDVFSLITDNKYYTDVFDKVREEKQGSGTSNISLSALASNDYSSYESLDALSEDNGYSDIIALSDLNDGSVFSDLVVYSLSTKVNFSATSNYWVYDNTNDELSSDLEPSEFTDSHYFYFKFIDGEYCNIIKKLPSGDRCLNYDSVQNKFIFEDVNDIDIKDYPKFIYSYNPVSSNIVLSLDSGELVGFNDQGEILNQPFTSQINVDLNSFKLDYKNSLNDDELITDSFLPIYGNKNIINSSFSVDNISLVTHNYNSSIEKNSNYIPLKSNVIYDEKYSLINTEQTSYFRQYSSISSGIRGNGGYNNFILGYNSEWYKYDFKPDEQTFFNVPFELSKGYSKININDCKLLNNGSIGGNSPLNSDKIYKKLYEYSDFRNTGKTTDVDNSKYICSWLWYNPYKPDESKWLDRYYNPDVVTKFDALSEESWNSLEPLESFSTSNGLQDPYYTYYKEFDKTVGVFDVESKLTIEPNCLYMYERLGENTSKALYSELSSFNISEKNDQVMDYQNNFYLITDTAEYDDEFCLNIALSDFDIDKFKGNNVFGNKNISLTIDKDFSPYTLSVDVSIIRYYDFDYNLIKTFDVGETIDDIIFTDDFNLFYVDCGGVIYTIEYLDFISNKTDTLVGKDISDIKYHDKKLYVLDSGTNSISSYGPEQDVLEFQYNVPPNHDLFIKHADGVYTGEGDYIDYSDSGEYYVLRGDEIYYKGISTPVISSDEDIVDFYVDVDNTIYVLKSNELLKISNKNIPILLKKVDVQPVGNLVSFNVVRYQRGGQIHEYIDVYDRGSGLLVHRYDKDLNSISKLSDKVIQGDLIKPKVRFNTKFLEKKLTIKVSLFNIFNYHKREYIELEIDRKFVDESNEPTINLIFSNKFGTITTYCNGSIIDIQKFDKNKYSFSNTLRDNKIFVGSTNISSEETIDSSVLSSENDMISGGFKIQNISIFNYTFNYFDVINYNRMYKKLPEASLIIPIKNRSYIEEIAGFYNQNKNIRKSEYGAVKLYGTELTDEMNEDVFNKIEKLYEDTYINLRLHREEEVDVVDTSVYEIPDIIIEPETGYILRETGDLLIQETGSGLLH